MESNTCPQNCEGFPYFPLPWISPNLISSNDNSTPWWATPRWVIIGIVIVAVVAAVYYSFRSYSRHGHQDTTAASPRLEITIVTPDVTIRRWKHDSQTPEADKPASTASTNPAPTASTMESSTASTKQSSTASNQTSSTASNQTSSTALTWPPPILDLCIMP